MFDLIQQLLEGQGEKQESCETGPEAPSSCHVARCPNYKNKVHS